MTVEVKLIGRLGNNLFQYAFGRILAEQHGLALHCEQIPYPGKVFLGKRLDHGRDATLNDFLPYFPRVSFELDGAECKGPVESYEVFTDGDWDGQSVDFPSLLDSGRQRRFELRGWFQRIEYYLPYIDKIRRWFRFLPAKPKHRVLPGDIVVNVRRGLDMAMVDWVVSPTYYVQALSSMSDRGTVYVCGTGLDCHIRAALDSFRPVYVDGDPYRHFSFLMQFERVVMSNSTFCWWAAFLSGACELCAPRPSSGYGFTCFPGVDLRIPGSRYQELDTDVEVFHPFLPDTTCVPSIERDGETGGWVLRVARSDGRAAVKIRFTTARLAFLEWLCAQTTPISGKELYMRFVVPEESRSEREIELERAIRELLDSTLLSVNPAYSELAGLGQ